MGYADSANSEKGLLDEVKDFFGQANLSFRLFDSWVPRRESFESGVNQLLGSCFQNCAGHDALVQSTTDVMQGAGHGVAEAANRYCPELAKNAALAALPIEAMAAKAVAALVGREITLVGGFIRRRDPRSNSRSATMRSFGPPAEGLHSYKRMRY